MNRRLVRPTPKLFGTSYQPPIEKPPSWRPWRPVLIMIAVVAGVTLIGHLPMFQLKTVEIKSAQSEIQTEATKLIGQPIFSSSIGRWISETRSKNPQIASLTCQRGLPDSLKCQVIYRHAQATWRSHNQDVYIDEAGYVFTADLTDNPALIIEDLTNSPVVSGQVVISSDLLGQYQRLVQMLQDEGFQIKSLFISESLFQVGARIELPDRPALVGLFTMTSPLSSQVKALKKVIDTKSDITERVDLRVSGYVYYK